jgi:small subunit ribosomal protein S16
MATKIRLQRHGRKGYAYYHIVVADSRAPRDGKFIERIGSYNPNTNPATVDLNFDRALYWVQTGAQPTDTTRNLLSDKGVYMKKHLLGGVTKGAFTDEVAEQKFNAWLTEKERKDETAKTKLSSSKQAADKARADAEKAANKAKAEAVSKKKAEVIAAQMEVEAPEEVQEETAETTEEAPVAVEATEAPVAEETPATEEVPAEEAPATEESAE